MRLILSLTLNKLSSSLFNSNGIVLENNLNWENEQLTWGSENLIWQ